MESIVFTNSRNQSVYFSYSGDYMIESYKGFTSAEVESNTIKGYMQNGYSFIGITFGMREMELNVLISANNMAEMYQKRASLSEIFNPLCGIGKLTYTNEYESRSIDCFVSDMPETKKSYGTLQLYTIGLTASNPLWYDSVEQGVKLQGFKGGLHFKFNFSHDVRFAESANVGTVINSGIIDTPVRIEIKNSSAVNPIVYLNDNKYIGINTTMSSGSTCIINTGYGNKTIAIDGASAMRYLKAGSEFFTLPVGASKIALECDTGYPECFVYWRNYYTGV